MSIETDVIVRDAARVVLLDRDDRVLLFCCKEPDVDRSFWITPGGGLEQGETHEQAALREMHEETGLMGVELGPCVWTRTHTFPWMGKMYCQRERFFLVRVDGHDVDPAGHTDEELVVLTQHRWWTADEIRAATDIEFAPRGMGDWLAHLFTEGVPTEPIDVSA